MEPSVVSLPQGEGGTLPDRSAPVAQDGNPGENPSGTAGVSAGGTAGGTAGRGRFAWLTGEGLDLVKSFFLGLTLTAAIYEVFPLPFLSPGRVLSVFDNPVSEAIVLLAAWALFRLGLMALRYRNEAKAYRAIRSPEGWALLEREIRAGDEAAFKARLAEVLKRARVGRVEERLMVRRLAAIARMLETHGWSAVQGNLLVQAEIDARKLGASYTAVQAFVWAIPVAGFIGTVVGIGDAILEFSRFVHAAEPSGAFDAQMREALIGASAGLGLAFNTTFLALILVIPVMMCASLLRRAEEDLLLSSDEFCLWELGTKVGAAAGADAIRGADFAAEWHARMERLTLQFARQVELAGHQLAGVQPLIKDFTDRLLETPARSAKGSAPPPAATAAQSGTAPQSAAQSGTAPQSAAQPGTAPQSAAQSGTAPQSAAQSGTAPAGEPSRS
jgi:hypothetical protein